MYMYINPKCMNTNKQINAIVVNCIRNKTVIYSLYKFCYYPKYIYF